MAPVYLNPPLDSDPYFQIAQQKDDQLLQKLIRFSNPASHSLSCPTFLHSIQEQRMINLLGESQQHGQKVGQRIANVCSSDLQISIQANNNKMNNISNNKLPIRKREVGEGSSTSDDVSSSSAKWMSSKMRLMHKMINSSNDNSTTTATDESVKVSQKLQNQMHDNGEIDSFSNSNSSSNNTIRVCSDCNTTTTPLWRSGPRGPKSLCNACGIRKRKARRAMEAAEAAAAAAGNGTVAGTTDSTFMKIKLQIKDKKPRTSHVGQYKKHCKIPESNQSQRKICFKDFALSLSNNSALKQVFPQDVEEAAILLMELSCGFIHT